MKYLTSLYIFLALFISIFIIDYFLINRHKLKLILNQSKSKLKETKKKNKTIGEIDYLVIKFNLNKKKLYNNKTIFWISIINSFIISLTSAVVMLLPLRKMWVMLIAFVLLFCLIYALYEIYGRHLKKLEERK